MQPGHRIAQYEITGKLGRGGMGVVYSAQDTRLDRQVALKFLPPEWSQDAEAKSRFLREARSASALDHPNIYTIYEIGETDDGSLFIVMPLYDGQTLKHKLESGTPGVEEVRRIVVQLFEALSVAHNAGIVHRDVKPANIMVTAGGTVKLLDFGIAKLTADLHLTKEGETLGTAAYMSPEQAASDTVDHRSDLWSAGVVLYEMLAGERPFKGEYEQAVIYSVLNEEPPSLTSLKPGIPQDLADVVHGLLSKDPDDRFGSSAEVLTAIGPDGRERGRLTRTNKTDRRMATVVVAALAVALAALIWLAIGDRGSLRDREVNTAATEPRQAAIAVMPFSNLNQDPQTDFLGYALADQIIGSLSYVKELLVRPSSSIRTYIGRPYSTRSAGEALSVDYLLNGSYQRQDDEMRLTIELVDVASDEIIWREPVQMTYQNAFQIQDAVSEKVLHRLQIEFSDDERRRMTFDVAKDPLAYDYYLQSVSYPETVDGNRLAVEMLERALVLDSTYAPAWNELGFRWQRIGQYALGGEDPILKAERAFLQALELNPNLLSALGNLSTLYTDLGRTLEGVRLADRMLDINPYSADGHFARGYGFRYAGWNDESVEEMSTAISLNSTDSRFRSAGISFVVVGDLEAAEKAFRIDEGSLYADAWLAEIMLRRGKPDAAIQRFSEVAREDPDGLLGLWSIGVGSALEGDFETGLKAARTWERSGILDAEARYYNAALFCVNRDIDKCIQTLWLAVEAGYFNVQNLLADRFTQTARSDPRFGPVLDRARQKQQDFNEGYAP